MKKGRKVGRNKERKVGRNKGRKLEMRIENVSYVGIKVREKWRENKDWEKKREGREMGR